MMQATGDMTTFPQTARRLAFPDVRCSPDIQQDITVGHMKCGTIFL